MRQYMQHKHMKRLHKHTKESTSQYLLDEEPEKLTTHQMLQGSMQDSTEFALNTKHRICFLVELLVMAQLKPACLSCSCQASCEVNSPWGVDIVLVAELATLLCLICCMLAACAVLLSPCIVWLVSLSSGQALQ